jgi:thioredoxin reductase
MRYMLQNYTMNQMYNVHFAAEIKKAYPDIIVATVGSIKDVAMAEEIIASGKADIVAMNRALHADYDMPKKYAESREWEHMPCLRCRCFRMASPHTNKLCSVNAIWGRFKEYPEGRLPKAAVKKKAAVIGGGPAGIEAMKWLLQRGHDVTLYEKSDKVGGHVRDAVAAPFKKDLKDYLGYMEAFAQNCGARVLLNTEATPEMLKAGNYDIVIAALGSDPIIPKIPGYDKMHVHWAPDAETGAVPCGENVVIVGGSSVGTEASINLAMQGKKVIVLEMDKKVNLLETGAMSDLIDMSDKNGVKRFMGWKLTEILDKSVIAENTDTGEKREFEADTVLMAVGLKPRRDKAIDFCHCCPETNFFIIGDCSASGDIRDATFSAFEAVRYL